VLIILVQVWFRFFILPRLTHGKCSARMSEALSSCSRTTYTTSFDQGIGVFSAAEGCLLYRDNKSQPQETMTDTTAIATVPLLTRTQFLEQELTPIGPLSFEKLRKVPTKLGRTAPSAPRISRSLPSSPASTYFVENASQHGWSNPMLPPDLIFGENSSIRPQAPSLREHPLVVLLVQNQALVDQAFRRARVGLDRLYFFRTYYDRVGIEIGTAGGILSATRHVELLLELLLTRSRLNRTGAVTVKPEWLAKSIAVIGHVIPVLAMVRGRPSYTAEQQGHWVRIIICLDRLLRRRGTVVVEASTLLQDLAGRLVDEVSSPSAAEIQYVEFLDPASGLHSDLILLLGAIVQLVWVLQTIADSFRAPGNVVNRRAQRRIERENKRRVRDTARAQRRREGRTSGANGTRCSIM
jgi:hypothetical protein